MRGEESFWTYECPCGTLVRCTSKPPLYPNDKLLCYWCNDWRVQIKELVKKWSKKQHE